MFLLLLCDFSVALLSTVVLLRFPNNRDNKQREIYLARNTVRRYIIGRFTHSSVLKFNIIQLDPP